ncbi:MAG: hypothetical protein MH204_01770, partial [Fimbriimonadaceae bacterium]|nr:hypothetical protein [Fimbriimonadaceae bacterium]
PQVRCMQRNHIRLFPPAMRERSWENFRRQERWGRQNGLAILTWCVWAFLVSVAFTLTWLICLEMLNRGLLDVSPESLRND